MSEQTLSEAEIADLRCLAGMIIPRSAKYGVPGADDDAIFSDVVNSIGRDRNDVRAALAKLRTLAGGPFSALDATRRAAVAAKLRHPDRIVVCVAGDGGRPSRLVRPDVLERVPVNRGSVDRRGVTRSSPCG